MERVIREDDEKIRKAEGIYYRSNNENVNIGGNISKKKYSIKDKFFLHLLIMFDIAIIIFGVQNKDFIFKEQFLNRINEYNNNISTSITKYIKEVINKEDEDVAIPKNEVIEESNEVIEEKNIEEEIRKIGN